MVGKIKDYLLNGIWLEDLSSLNTYKSILIKSLRFSYFTVKEFNNNELTLRAMSLVYTTLLSLVPLLAFSFSILKAFGVVDSQLEPILVKFFSPLGEKGVEVTHRIMDFVNNMKVGVLGTVGLIALIWTVFSVIKKIDDSLNKIWHIKKGRSFIRRFSNYISLTLIGPVVIFVVLGLTATLASNAIVKKLVVIEPIGTLVVLWGRILPYLIVSLVFTFIYSIVPNTKVKIQSALLGGIIGGVAWQATGVLFALSVAKSTKYIIIYSSFAVLILFMIWLYISWLILLIGAQISYCHQNLNFYGFKLHNLDPSSRMREKIVLRIMYLIGKRFTKGEKYFTHNELIEYTEIPHDTVMSTLNELEKNNLIRETSDEPPGLIPARDLSSIKIDQVITSIRKNPESELLLQKDNRFQEIDKIVDTIDKSIKDQFNDMSIKDLIDSNN